MAHAYTAIYRSGTAGHMLWADAWPGFEAKWKELSAKGWRLRSISAGVDGASTQFVGTWEPGTDGHALWVSNWSSFEAKWKELSAAGLRLVGIASWMEGSTAMYAGAFRAGTDGHALWVSTWSSFEAKWKELTAVGLRLHSVSSHVEGSKAMYAGVFRAGSSGHGLWASDWSAFVAKWKEWSAGGLRLVGISSHQRPGRPRTWVGAYLPGQDSHVLWAGVDWESFVARWHDCTSRGMRIVDSAIYPHPCKANALNQVVMPTGSYDYGVTGHDTFYRWPVDVVGSSRYARLSAITGIEAFLTLPFSDTAVQRFGIWLYSPGSYHHAGDFARADSNTFEVKASAAGRIVHVGWDNWSGNTVIVSHDIGGTDTYRTVYMHLRNGATNDCEAAWTQSVPTLSGDVLTQYTTHLNATGCPRDGTRQPDPAHWGSDQQTIPVAVGNVVARGQTIAWAGNTGPGGKTGAGGPNTHLHIFWTRRDANGRWYFYDPYGIYAPPDAYPAGVTDAPSGPCVRYPVGWRNNRPQYP